MNKAIQHGKEHRKPYHKSEAFDAACRPHGGCPWCERNRLVVSRRIEEQSIQELREGFDDAA